jgi:hypothetical protein
VLTMNRHTKAYKWASDELVLLFSYSFEEGAILTKDAFILFLKVARSEEVSHCEFVFLKPEQAALTPYEFYGSLDIHGLVLGTLEYH